MPSGSPSAVGAGRYRVKGFLGQGGRKRVYLADDAASDREVAVSMFDTAGVGESVQARARREAQAMRKLGDDPHVVRVFDTGEEGGNPFIVSEYMPGGDVEGLLAAEGGHLAVPRAVEIASDVCRALEHAHARGIVHRDLKPANVWLDDDGHARLGDFGLATTEGRSRMSGGTLVGTVAYLPPEQAVGEAGGPESDLYSLGALLYEMLTGQPPFPGDDAVSIISQHLHADPVPPSRHNADVPEALDRVVLGLLAKRREDRPSGAAGVRESLAAALAEPPAREGAEGTENPLDSLAGGVYVGREAELERMRDAVDGAQEGHGGLLLLVGEPGIGKTRAAEELATYAQVQGARVHWGRCREDEGAPAYWPWVQALRSYVRDADPVALAWQMGAGAPEITQLVPELAEGQGGTPKAPDESEEARFRLFDSVTTFLCSAGNDRPLVLVLDDLHWADEPTLLLLKFAAREVGSSGLLIVGTYRDVELGRHHPLARVLGELAGVESAERIVLRGLDVDDVERYIGMTAGGPVPAGLAGAVHAQTDGNPFFVGEVVRLLASEGRLSDADPGSWEPSIPQGVREVVGRRLDRLTLETNEALKVAAAIGREIDLEVAIRVTDLSDQQLMTVSREAVAERLVTEIGPGRFSFAHALVRDTLYEELSPGRRSQLHEKIGLALEQLHGDDPAFLDQLAHHFLEATPRGDPARAIDYAERAAAQAMEKLAYEDAAELYGRVLEALELSGEPDQARRCALLLALGGAQMSAGNFADSRAAFLGAAEIARSIGNADSLTGAALGVALLSEAGRCDDETVAVVEEALEAIDPGPSPQRAALLGALAQELYWVDAQGRSGPLSAEAVEIAREIGDPHTLAAALHRRYFIPIGPDDARVRLEIVDEIQALSERTGDREMVIRCHAYRLREFLELGDVPAADQELASFARLAEQLRMPQHIWHIHALRGMRAFIDGDLEGAERLADQARRDGERAQQPLAAQYYGIQLTQIRRVQGRAAELLLAVRDLAERYPAIPAWRTALISLEAIAGNHDEARIELERFTGNDPTTVVPPDAQMVPALGLLGEAAALLGDTERARSIYGQFAPYAGLAIIPARAASCAGPVDRILGLLTRSLGRMDDAVRHLEASLELSARMGDRPFLAQGRVDLGETLLQRDRRGDRERGLQLLAEAISSAREIGARGIADSALELRLEAQGLAGIDVTTSIDDVVSALESERPDLRAHAAPDGTVAILFSDIEDSTVLTERLGDERWLEVLREHNALFRERVSRHNGFEVKSQGDGFMLAFPDPCEALRCAAEVQRAFAEREREGAEEGDFFGKNVILAARIAAQACGGEILVSEPMREAAEAADHADDWLSFDDGRELELKGLAGTHRVYRAEWSGSPVSP